jgi:hypothetical protein
LNLPESFHHPLYENITFLTWNIDLKEVLRENDPANDKLILQDRISFVNIQYRKTLVSLQKWLTRTSGMTIENYQYHLNFRMEDLSKGGGVDVTKYDHRILALCLMRWEVETRFGHGTISISSEPSISDSFRSHVLCSPFFLHWPNQKWEGLFISIYAIWYFRVSKARGLGMLTREVIQSEVEHIPTFYRAKKPMKKLNIYTGCLAFPSISGLPLTNGMRQKTRIPAKSGVSELVK